MHERTGRKRLAGPGFRRRLWVGVCLMLAVVITATACAEGGGTTTDDGASGELVELTVIHPSGPSLIPLYFQSAVATELGFWEEEGLDVNIVGLSSGSAGAIQQLVAGNGDVSNESPQVVFDAIEEGFGDEIRIFGTWLYEQPFSVRTYPDSDIETIEDLAGKTIGVSESAGGEVTLLEATLKSHGITDYKLLPIGDGSPQTIRSLETRSVDAYSTASKDFLGMEAQGIEFKTVSIPEWEDLTANIFTVRTSYLEENHDAVVGYLRGLAKASLFAYENMDAAVEITAKYQEEGMPDFLVKGWVEQTLSQSVPLDLIEAGTPFQVAETELEKFLDFYKQAGAIDEDVDIALDKYIVDDIAKEAGDFDMEAIRELAASYNG